MRGNLLILSLLSLTTIIITIMISVIIIIIIRHSIFPSSDPCPPVYSPFVVIRIIERNGSGPGLPPLCLWTHRSFHYSSGTCTIVTLLSSPPRDASSKWSTP